MKIEVNTDIMMIEIWDKTELISRLNFDMCDEDMLEDNAKEIGDLLRYLNKDFKQETK